MTIFVQSNAEKLRNGEDDVCLMKILAALGTLMATLIFAVLVTSSKFPGLKATFLGQHIIHIWILMVFGVALPGTIVYRNENVMNFAKKILQFSSIF